MSDNTTDPTNKPDGRSVANISREFFKSMEEKYPEQMKQFWEWIVEFAKNGSWFKLEGAEADQQRIDEFCNLPLCIQTGICNEYFFGHLLEGVEKGIDANFYRQKTDGWKPFAINNDKN